MFGFLAACDDLEYQPVDQLSNDLVMNSPELMGNATIGNYSRLKESNYTLNFHYMSEYPGDNSILSGSTSSHQIYSYNFLHIPNSTVCLNFWRQAYWGIYGANVVIEAIPDNASQDLLQLKGENLFLRALMHFDLVRVFGRPYTQNPETNLGVMIRDNTDVTALPPRATVKATYEFIVADLIKAGELMSANKSASYATKEAAWALAARAYLYMEQNDKAIEYADKVINSGRYSLVTTANLPTYFRLTPEANPETIFAVKYLTTENRARSSVGSMYHGDGGWGEIYASRPLRLLLAKFPHDQRNQWIEPNYVLDDEGNKIPDPTEDVGYQLYKRNGVSKYFNVKYTYQEGIPMLSSPVRIRLAEMYLIKAEAYAKKGNNSQALAMVNIIRERAGLSGDELFSESNMMGYSSVMDVVLDERRLELAWEGHRGFDLFRNNRPVDRSYVVDLAWSGPKLIEPTSNAIVHLIPDQEITLNPNLQQNP